MPKIFGRGPMRTLAAHASLPLAGLILACTVGGLHADQVARTHNAKPTQAWVAFCQKNPAECSIDPAEPLALELTPSVWRTIKDVNRRVNGEIKAKPDQEHWGVADRWDFAEDGIGDCEDFQLVKRRLLVAAGIPRRAMRMTVVIDSEGLGHAVMMVRTDQGDFILDNRRNAVLPWRETGYIYVMQESQNPKTAWVALGRGAASVITTAVR